MAALAGVNPAVSAQLAALEGTEAPLTPELLAVIEQMRVEGVPRYEWPLLKRLSVFCLRVDCALAALTTALILAPAGSLPPLRSA